MVRTYKGYKYLITEDENYDSPDDWRDDEIFLVYDHRDLSISRDGFLC